MHARSVLRHVSVPPEVAVGPDGLETGVGPDGLETGVGVKIWDGPGGLEIGVGPDGLETGVGVKIWDGPVGLETGDGAKIGDGPVGLETGGWVGRLVFIRSTPVFFTGVLIIDPPGINCISLFGSLP
jgi:hypothetical protein